MGLGEGSNKMETEKFDWLLKPTSEQELKDRMRKETYSEAEIFGDWKVYNNGDMVYRDGQYEIAGARLKEQWITHLISKRWIDYNEFIPAYLQACYNAEINKVDILIDY